ncbi:MAG: DUF2155 domain-containing protein [Alphaproteobacteria bacterium]|nr:DUF2155 domain-containing protein [Alphaproteobacteria bacterium]
MIRKNMKQILLISTLILGALNSSIAEDDDLEKLLKDEQITGVNTEIASEVLEEPKNKGTSAEIKILDKVSTKLTAVDYKIMSRNRYKNLEIIVFNCIKPTQKLSNHKMLVGIWEHSENKDIEKIFLGWLFSIDKNLNQIEHRFFNIADFKCKL